MAETLVTDLNFKYRENGAWQSYQHNTKVNGAWQFQPTTPISYVGVGASVENTSGAALTPPLPSGLQDGDLVICFWHSRQSGRANTWPSGWVEFVDEHSTSGNCTMNFAYKFYTTGDTDPTITSTTDNTDDNPIAQCAAFRNVDPHYPIEQVGLADYATSAETTLGPVPGLTTRYSGGAVIAACDWRFNRTVSQTAAEGDGLTWTHIGNRTHASSAYGGINWDYALTANADTVVTDKNYTFSGGCGGATGVVFALAKRPRPAGTNEVLKEDLATIANPITLWRGMTTADPNEDATNTQITRESTDPSPFVPIGQSVASTHYRRLKVQEFITSGTFDVTASSMAVVNIPAGTPTTGVLNIGDLGGSQGIRLNYTNYSGNTFTGLSRPDGGTGTYPSGTRVALMDSYDGAQTPSDSYRCQLINNSSSNSFYVFRYGDLLTVKMDIRFQNPTPQEADDEESQVWQLKQTSSNRSPLISVNQHPDHLALRTNNGVSGVDRLEFEIPPGGEWFSQAITVFFHPTNGTIKYYTNYGDGYELAYSGTGIKTIYVAGEESLGGPYVTQSIGPYQECAVPAMYRDYANIQVIRNWDEVS